MFRDSLLASIKKYNHWQTECYKVIKTKLLCESCEKTSISREKPSLFLFMEGKKTTHHAAVGVQIGLKFHLRRIYDAPGKSSLFSFTFYCLASSS
jgi:hypothetical protein